MADISKVNVNGTTYNVKDSTARSAVGSPLVANTASAMTNTSKIYVYTGNQSGYSNGHWYYHNGSTWVDGGVYNSQGIGANAITGAKIAEPIKSTLLDLLQHVAYTVPNGLTYYTALYNVLYDVAIESISATFSQGANKIFSTDTLDALKQYLTVKVIYEDDTEIAVSSYSLSGTLSAGTSTITVSYYGKTATFTVNVTEAIDLTPAWSTYAAGTGVALTIDSAANSFNMRTTSNGSNRTASSNVPIDIVSNYTYRFTFDADYTSGTGRVVARATSTWNVVDLGITFTQSGHYEHEVVMSSLSGLSSETSFSVGLFITGSSSQAGNITFRNFKLIRYLAG